MQWCHALQVVTIIVDVEHIHCFKSTRSFKSNQEADKLKSKTIHKCFPVTVKSNRLSWVKSNQEVLTLWLDLGYRLYFGQPFSPTPGISVALQYAKYNTKYEISSHFNSGLAYWWGFHNSDTNFAVWCWFTTTIVYLSSHIINVYICFWSFLRV